MPGRNSGCASLPRVVNPTETPPLGERAISSSSRRKTARSSIGPLHSISVLSASEVQRDSAGLGHRRHLVHATLEQGFAIAPPQQRLRLQAGNFAKDGQLLSQTINQAEAIFKGLSRRRLVRVISQAQLQ